MCKSSSMAGCGYDQFVSSKKLWTKYILSKHSYELFDITKMQLLWLDCLHKSYHDEKAESSLCIDYCPQAAGTFWSGWKVRLPDGINCI